MARASVESRRIRKEVLELSAKHPRYGYRRITALLRREGFDVNPKRVARIRREEGIKVSKKQRRMRRLGTSTAQRARAERPRQVWSWDFVEDQTENGSRFRILTILDEHTRQCVAMHVDWSIRAVDVITVLEAAIARYGAPEHLRSDNGPEFIAYAIQDWMEKASIKTIYITPGSPWENGHIESFHDKLRDECLNRELFGSLLEARVILETWRIEYNESRPHSSLGYQTPGEFARRSNSGLRSPSGLPYTQSCHQHQTQPQTTTSRTSDLSCPTCGVRPCQTSPRLGFGMVFSFHFFEKGKTLRCDMITDGQVVGFGLKAQNFETNFSSFGIRKLRKFFKDFRKAHTNTLEEFIPSVSSEGRYMRGARGASCRHRASPERYRLP